MKTLVAIALVATALVACTGAVPATPGATPGASPTGPASMNPTPTSQPTALPTSQPSSQPTATPDATGSPSPSTNPGADVAIVQVEQTGGMLPPWETLRFYPSVSLYADGRLITQGPQIDIYPGPALPNLQVTRLTPAGVEQVRAWAREAGLQGPDRQLGPLILDAGETLFTIVYPDGTTHRTGVTDLSASQADIGAVREFLDVMLSLRTWLPEEIAAEDEPYSFDRLLFVSSPVNPGDIVDPGLATEMEWPLDEPLATLGDPISEPTQYRCAVLSGEDLTEMLPLFEGSNELTLWRSGDELYSLRLHPLLPDDEGCLL